MIAEEITERVGKFCRGWKLLTAQAPVLELDGTWPSMGVLDLLTFRLRLKPEYDAHDKALLKFAASYLGTLAYHCWKEFGVLVSLLEGQRGVTLLAAGGDSLPDGRRYVVEIERYLEQILRQPPRVLPVIEGFQREVSPTHNLVSLFGLGVCLGLSPFGDGPWLKETVETFRPNLEKAVKHLAKSCAEHYERLHPNEMFGQVAELYLSGLIFPPAGMGEVLPAMRATTELVGYCRNFKINAATIRKLGSNLAQSPDELISAAGIALAGATLEPPLHRGLIGATNSKGTYTGLLRSAMLDARRLFGLRHDWIFSSEQVEEDYQRFETEKVLGFLPWVYIDPMEFRRKELRPYLKEVIAPLAFFDMEGAIKVADRILGELPNLIDLRLQRLQLDILRQDFERADHGFRELAKVPGCEDEPRLFGLWGLCDLCRDDRRKAVVHLENAFALTPIRHPKRSDIANDYAWSLMMAERFPEAIPVLDIAIDHHPFALAAYLNKSFCLRLMRREEEAERIFQQILPLAPTDRRVFAGLRFEQLLDDIKEK